MGMFAPLYALFVEENIEGVDEFVIGVSISIFLVSRSLLQIPIATLIDKIKGETDDYDFLVIFSVLMGIVHLGFLGVTQIWQLYLMQLLLGILTAVTYPSYMALFTRHIDKHMEGTEWGVYYTFIDVSSAVLATLGGYIASAYNFDVLIVLVSALCIMGAVVLVPIKPYIFNYNK